MDITPRERVRRAVRHQQPDRVPWHVELTDQAAAKVADYLGDPFFQTKLENHLGYATVAHTERSPEEFHEVEPGYWQDLWGVVWDRRDLRGAGDAEWGRPVNCMLPRPTLRWYRFPEPPRPEDCASVPAQLARQRHLFTGVAEGHLFEIAWALRGMEDLLTDMLRHPAFVDDLMDGIVEYNLKLIGTVGVFDQDMMQFGDDWGAERGLLMGPRLWRRFIKPRMARMFEAAHRADKLTYLHSDGDCSEILPDLIEIGLDIYNPFQPEAMDVFEMKRQYGGEITFHGGIGLQTTLLSTPERVRADVGEMQARCGEGGGYILGSAHAILGDAPAENVVALLRAARGQ